MTVLTLNFGERPASWELDRKFKLHDGLLESQKEIVEAAGPYFVGLLSRKDMSMSLTDDLIVRSLLEEKDKNTIDVIPDFRDEDDPELLGTDPEADIQDHYKILGLEKYRWKATENDIKTAYRRKMLKYHPDKSATPNRFYICVQRAFTELMNPITRMYWDSVDPNIDESIPDPRVGGEFFSTYGPVFEREARFSLNPKIPSLGCPDDTQEHVNRFYEAWLNFSSWRTFFNPNSVKEISKCESRSERRYMERVANDAKSLDMKRAYHARIYKLVQQALSLDPRIKRRTSRLNHNKSGKNAQQLEEEKLAKLNKEREEVILQQQMMLIRDKKNNKEKERNLRKSVRRLCREQGIPAESDKDNTPSPVSLEDVCKLLSSIKDMEKLSAFLEKLNEAKTSGKEAFLSIISDELRGLSNQ